MSETTTANSGLPARFFERADWITFGTTTALVWLIYLFTLSPDIDLDHSGIFTTSALYPGVAEPPGHPLWALFGCVFIHLLPWGNIAWRVAMASALAGALTCGLVALLVSRLGGMALETLVIDQAGRASKIRPLRLACAVVSGLALGLDTCVWRQAVVPETWTFELLLLALTVTMLTRWMFIPAQRRYLYLAALLCGLCLSESQADVPLILGIPFLVLIANRALGRDLFFLLTLLLGVLYVLTHTRSWHDTVADELGGFTSFLIWMLAAAGLIYLGLAIHTRAVFSEWKSSSLCALLVLAGVGFYLLLPLYSLTDPPLNWGDPRTVAGFFHVVRREQYETLYARPNLEIVLAEFGLYLCSLRDDLGVIYLPFAALPLLTFRKWPPAIRGWLTGFFVLGLFLGTFTVLGLNSGFSRSAIEVDKPYYATTHFVIALFAGLGLLYMAIWYLGGTPANSETSENSAQRAMAVPDSPAD